MTVVGGWSRSIRGREIKSPTVTKKSLKIVDCVTMQCSKKLISR